MYKSKHIDTKSSFSVFGVEFIFGVTDLCLFLKKNKEETSVKVAKGIPIDTKLYFMPQTPRTSIHCVNIPIPRP